VLPQSDRFKNAHDSFHLKFGSSASSSTSLNSSPVKEQKKTNKNKFEGVKTVTIDFKPIKEIQPMHLKLYESTLQTVSDNCLYIYFLE